MIKVWKKCKADIQTFWDPCFRGLKYNTINVIILNDQLQYQFFLSLHRIEIHLPLKRDEQKIVIDEKYKIIKLF